MNSKYGRTLQLLAVLLAPVITLAVSTGPPPKRTGVPADGGVTCTACHTTYAPANSDPRGRVSIEVGSYTPGIKQLVWVTVEHPEATKWGFQLTARLASDETKEAGTFTPTSDIRVRCDPSGDAPCNGGLEFASHVRASTQVGVRQKASWAVEWTPPSTDSGDVVFYAAGNAADNSNTNAGDRIYNSSLRVASAGCGTLDTVPTITGVVNSASLLGDTGMSLNAMVTIFGTGFAPPGTSRAAGRNDTAGRQFTRELSCVSVEIGGQHVPVVFVSDKQINVQAPTVMIDTTYDVQVALNRNRPNERKAELKGVRHRFHSPAFFTFLPSLTVAAQIFPNYETLANPAVFPGARPAKPGEIAILYGTGFGATEPVFQAGELPNMPAPLRDPVTVMLGGVALAPQDIIYAGLAQEAISGLYQFNIRIPPGTPDGDLPLVVHISGRQTQPGVYLPVRR